ncbi:MAG: HAMP domain-containing sensor histidine kinase, partial [Hyphomicrobiaceae bacterium]
EILIFVPSLANFRVNWLSDRINAAHLAALASDAVPGGAVPPALRNELLATAQVKGIAIKRMGQRRMVLPPEEELKIDATYDLRVGSKAGFEQATSRFGLIADAMTTFTMSPNWTMRVIGQPSAPRSGQLASAMPYAPDDFVEIILPGAPLLDAMYRFGLNILGLSIIISGITAALVYLALSGLLVRPMMRLAHNMIRFGEKPDASRIIEPSPRADEIGTTERELARMQGELVQLLQQQTRLAQLGLAVAKINHDLRNMLATAQLMSDRLAALPDPAVQRFAPKLIASLDRAIGFCNDTLKFGQADEPGARRNRFNVAPLAEEVGEGLGLPRETMGWRIDADPNLEIDADRGQIYRVLNNLVRNAVQAIETTGERPGVITLTARREGASVRIELADNGPGVPEKALANLFQPFKGGVRKGGSGLGLAIAAELVAAHGGELRHVAGQPGAVFVFDIPDRAQPEANGR